jgi:hypothetical protein
MEEFFTSAKAQKSGSPFRGPEGRSSTVRDTAILELS